jgi:hypothetical protein
VPIFIGRGAPPTLLRQNALDIRICAKRRVAVMRGGLLAVLVSGQWNVALKVHSVVQNTNDFDRSFGCYPVHQEVTSATSVSRDVERTETRHDLVSDLGARNVRTFDKFADRLNDRVPINS